MNEDDLIDDFNAWGDDDDHSLMELVRWWEGKRFQFNYLVLIAGALGLLLGGGVLLIINAGYIGDLILGVILYGIFANLAFTSGWVLEIFLKVKRIGILDFSKGNNRRNVYWLGVFISIGITFFFAVGFSIMSAETNGNTNAVF